MKWNTPLSVHSIHDALEYAFRHQKLHRNGIRAWGVCINCCVGLEPAAESLIHAVGSWAKASGFGPVVFRTRIHSGKPKDWWSLAFLFEEQA